MIKPICNKCENELKEFGGILLSPPDNEGKIKKMHLCKECYEKVKDLLEIKS